MSPLLSGIPRASFRGFLLQARQINAAGIIETEAIGTFSQFPASTGGLECAEQIDVSFILNFYDEMSNYNVIAYRFVISLNLSWNRIHLSICLKFAN